MKNTLKDLQMMMNNIKANKDKAKQAIQEVTDYLTKNKECFGYMDLKLHDAFYSIREISSDFPLLGKQIQDNEERGTQLFISFCDDYYLWFCDTLQEEYSIDFDRMRHNLWRTSSFYLHDRETFYLDSRNDFMFIDIIEKFANDDNGIVESLINDTFNVEELCHESTILIEEYYSVSHYLINELLKDVKEESIEIIATYRLLENFMTGQVQAFKDWLYREEFMLKEKEEEIQVIENEKMGLKKQIENQTLKELADAYDFQLRTYRNA